MVNRTDLDPQTPLSSTPGQLRGPFTRWPRAADTALAMVVFLATVFHSSEDPNQDFVIRAVGDVPIAGYMVIAVASGALYWRRYQPLVVLGVNLTALALSWGLGYSYDFFGLPIAMYSVGRYATNDRWSYVAVGGTIAVIAVNDSERRVWMSRSRWTVSIPISRPAWTSPRTALSKRH